MDGPSGGLPGGSRYALVTSTRSRPLYRGPSLPADSSAAGAAGVAFAELLFASCCVSGKSGGPAVLLCTASAAAPFVPLFAAAFCLRNASSCSVKKRLV